MIGGILTDLGTGRPGRETVEIGENTRINGARSTMIGLGLFRGQVVQQRSAHDVVSPAYDALTVPQRQQFRADHPDSYLHVTRSAADEPDADTVDNATLVARGREALERIIEKELFAEASEPAFYVYGLSIGSHTQLGLVCEVSSEHFADVARPHEATDAARAALLAEHFATVQAASSPIACAVRDEGALEDALARAAVGEPVLVLAGEDGLRQTVWQVDDPAITGELSQLVGQAPLYIIDGHHRAAANGQLLAGGKSLPILAAIFPEQSLHLVGFHRMLKLPAGLDTAAFLQLVSRRFRVEIVSDVATIEAGHVAMVVDGEWHVVYFDERPVAGSTQVLLGSLDPVVLEREILRSLVASSGPLDITYIPDTEPFSVIVDMAEADGRVPIFVPPVAIGDMMAVAEGGLIMPAKSTYFTPKVRSGLFLRMFHELNDY